MSHAAHTLLEEIRRESEKLHHYAEDARHYIEKSEPHEAIRSLNHGKDTIRLIERHWEELHRLIEHL